MPSRSIAITALALVAAASAAPAQAGDVAPALARQLGPGTRVAAQSEAGDGITFIGTRHGAAIPLQASTPRAAALEAGERFGSRFGLGPGAALRVSSVEPIRDGSFAAHLQQTIDGVPVLGGELAVGLDPAGDLLSIGGELEPAERVDASPAIDAGGGRGEPRSPRSPRTAASPPPASWRRPPSSRSTTRGSSAAPASRSRGRSGGSRSAPTAAR